MKKWTGKCSRVTVEGAAVAATADELANAVASTAKTAIRQNFIWILLLGYSIGL